eukprot:TRINITY_DN12565_c0_g3_i2.p4 TRINITY_DN12565_c0_g3~~TRINITY_DN12565_c0_g3_i2.p4  ORF type:complete len:135 (+),score=2.34 TRINITY_DN12565_c0_g3_i2:735-1139(+)
MVPSSTIRSIRLTIRRIPSTAVLHEWRRHGRRDGGGSGSSNECGSGARCNSRRDVWTLMMQQRCCSASGGARCSTPSSSGNNKRRLINHRSTRKRIAVVLRRRGEGGGIDCCSCLCAMLLLLLSVHGGPRRGRQ